MRSLGWALLFAAGGWSQEVKPRGPSHSFAGDTSFLDFAFDMPLILFVRSGGVDEPTENPASMEPSPDLGQASLTTGYASLLPGLNLPDLYEFSETFALRPNGTPWGGSVSVKSHGLITGKRGMEYGLAAHRRFSSSWGGQSLGLALKYFDCQGMAAPPGKASGPAYLMDVGYSTTFARHFLAAVAVRNIGRESDGVRPAFFRIASSGQTYTYLAMEDAPAYSLTPLTAAFTLRATYDRDIARLRLLSCALRTSWLWQRNGKAGGFSMHGAETTVLNTLWGRAAMLADESAGNPLLLGLGFRLFNHLSIAYSWMSGGNDFLVSQKSIGLSLDNLLYWQRLDWTWWKKPD
jgi:hypothetical protein